MRVQSRRTKVAELLLRGTTNQYEICRQLGMEPGQRTTISRDISAIKEEWKNRTAICLDEHREKELARLDVVIAAAFQGWERSLMDAETREAAKRGEQETARKISRGQAGNPAFLKIVCDCIAQKRAILGLDAEKDQPPPTGNSGDRVRMSVEEVMQADRDVEEYRRGRFGPSVN